MPNDNDHSLSNTDLMWHLSYEVDLMTEMILKCMLSAHHPIAATFHTFNKPIVNHNVNRETKIALICKKLLLLKEEEGGRRERWEGGR